MDIDGVSKRPAFQFYPDSWLSSMDISLMSIAEEGAYHRLLCHAWMQPDCGLPDDDVLLAKLSKMGRKWVKSGKTIRSKFILVESRLYNPRLLEERKKQDLWIEKSSKAGKMSGLARRQNEPTFNQPLTNLEPTLNQPLDLVDVWFEPNGNSSSSSSSSSSVTTLKPLSGLQPDSCQKSACFVDETNTFRKPKWFDDQHERWYSGFWNRSNKQASRKAFEKRVKTLANQNKIQLEEAVEFLISEATKDRAKFEQTEDWSWRANMHPATWLNGQRWEDQQPEIRTRVKKSGDEALIDRLLKKKTYD